MRIGVTGGAGFVGRYVCEVLHYCGHEVLVFDHYREPRTPWPTVLGSVTDATAVYELAAHVDGIIHLAAVLGTQETIKAPLPSAQTNILGSLNVFEAADRYQIAVVYAGVGNAWMRDHGTGSYTISKTAAEDYARMFNAYRRGRVAIVRPMNAYGPRQAPAAPYGPGKVRKVIPAFACRALTQTPIEVYGDGTQVSDCVYVADVARVFVQAMERAAGGDVPERPVEVGPAESCTVNEIAALVAREAAEAIGGAPVSIAHIPMRPGEVPNAVVSADVATLLQVGMDTTGFVPLEEGIGRTVAWFAEHWMPTWDRRAPLAGARR